MPRILKNIIVSQNTNKHAFSCFTGMPVKDNFSGKKFIPSKIIKVKTIEGLKLVKKHLRIRDNIELDIEYPLSEQNYQAIVENIQEKDVAFVKIIK